MRGLARRRARGRRTWCDTSAERRGPATIPPATGSPRPNLASERAMKAFPRPRPPCPVPRRGAPADLEGLRWVVDLTAPPTSSTASGPSECRSPSLKEATPLAGAIAAPLSWATLARGRGPGGELGAARRRLGSVRGERRAPEQRSWPPGFRSHEDRLPRYLAAVERALERFEDLRRPGAAPSTFAWTAGGCSTGSSSSGSRPGTWPPGPAHLREAGGVVTDWDATSVPVRRHPRGPPAVHEALRDRLRRPVARPHHRGPPASQCIRGAAGSRRRPEACAARARPRRRGRCDRGRRPGPGTPHPAAPGERAQLRHRPSARGSLVLGRARASSARRGSSWVSR